MEFIERLMHNRVAPAHYRMNRRIIRSRLLGFVILFGMKIGLITLIFYLAASEIVRAYDELSDFRVSAGFENDQRHMIDPIGGERDENGNLVRANNRSVNRGGSTSCGLLSAAIGNLFSVVVDGNHNTVIVNATQNNTGDVTASTSLNGRINLGCR